MPAKSISVATSENHDSYPPYPIRVTQIGPVPYSLIDVSAIPPEPETRAMPSTAIATAMTITYTMVEALCFLLIFGWGGFAAIMLATLGYTLINVRTRQWLRGRARNRFQGSGG